MKNLKSKFIYYSSCLVSVFLNLILLFFEKVNLKKVNFFLSKKIVLLFDDDIYVTRDEYCPVNKKIIKNVILALPSKGCRYFFETGGCAMCGFNNEIKKYNFHLVHASLISVLVKIFLLNLEKTYSQEDKGYSMLSIFMAGSFLNERELPRKAQNLVVEYFLSSPFNKLFIESRVEYIPNNYDYLSISKKRIDLKEKEIEVSLGLESSNDHIRNNIIKKGVERIDYENAVQLLKSQGIIVSTYVLVGNPHSTENEMLDNSFNTIRYLWSVGADIANIEVYSVQESTPWAYLYGKGIFRPIGLWSLLELFKKLETSPGKWRLGEFADWPKPIACPSSCPECEEKILDLIKRIRITHNLKLINDLKGCSCQPKGV